jgi:uncharacterized membrane protein
MEAHIRTVGFLLLLLSLIHLIFPRYLKWKLELKKLSLLNRQMMITHTFFIALTVLLMGLLCIFYTGELVNTYLGNALSMGLALFWTLRLLTQLFGYSMRLWQGRQAETFVHVVYSLALVYTSAVFWITALELQV